jgi:hypothetical protein
VSIAQNLNRVRNEIADACARAGRDASSVALMAVSKTHPAEAILEAHAAGQTLFGENRVQEFAAKRDALSTLHALRSTLYSFHLIGPLQNNKTAKAAELFTAVDTLTELKTAQRLNAAAQALNKTLPVLIEIKLSPEASKHGLAPESLPAFLDALKPLTNLRVDGLMTVPPYTDDPELARPFFARLRQLRDENGLRELSMGMSHDFPIAIAEGSTCVRIGTAIFGARDYTL